MSRITRSHDMIFSLTGWRLVLKRPFYTVVSTVLVLLLGSSAASATEVILQGSKVIRIENLEAPDNQGEPSVFDVHFVYTSAREGYGEPFPSENFEFDYTNGTQAERAVEAILEALNDNNPIPLRAGPAGTDQFFVPFSYSSAVAEVNAYGGEFYPTQIWGDCLEFCTDGRKDIQDADVPLTFAKFVEVGDNRPPPPDPETTVDLSGTVKDAEGTGLCSMVLASGKFQFSCDPNGPFELNDLPRESDGSVKRQVYADGFFPNIDVLQDSTDETVFMQRSGTCPDYNAPNESNEFPDSSGKRIDISGSVLLGTGNAPICAMVLANGQFMFSCDETGQYALNIPLDAKGQFKLQVYADGFAPNIQVFDEFSPDNIVRMARATECQ